MRAHIRKNIQELLETTDGEEIAIIPATQQTIAHTLTRRELKHNEPVLWTAKIDEYFMMRKGTLTDQESEPYQKFYIPEKFNPKKLPLAYVKREKKGILILELQIEAKQ